MAKKWEFIETHDGKGNILPEFLPPSPADIPVKGKEDDEMVMAMVNSMETKEAAKIFAKDLIQMRRSLRSV